MWSICRYAAIFDFIDRNYLQKSVTEQIPHDAGLTSAPYTGRTFLSQRGLNQQNEFEAVRRGVGAT